MKNSSMILVVVFLLAVLGIGGYALSQQSQSKFDASMQKDESMKQEDSITKNDEEGQLNVQNNSSSRYIEYSKESLNLAAIKRRVLYFYASWCPTCRPADANFKQNSSQIPEDVLVIRVNYNDPDTDQEEKDLAKKYGITYQHTFVQIDGQGKEITKWNGGQINELLAKIK